MQTIVTLYGTVTIAGSGSISSVFISANAASLYDWAMGIGRDNGYWPCSTLRGKEIFVSLNASSGDLVELEGDREEVAGDELTAWIDDVLTLAASKVYPECHEKATTLLAMRTIPDACMSMH